MQLADTISKTFSESSQNRLKKKIINAAVTHVLLSQQHHHQSRGKKRNRPQRLQKNTIPVPFPNLLKPFGGFCRLTFMPFDEFSGRAARDASSAGERETPLLSLSRIAEATAAPPFCHPAYLASTVGH